MPYKPTSVWMDTTPHTTYPAPGATLEVDVCVAGGGILGLLTAALLKQGGRTVALSQVARISEEEGPIQVIREGTQRYATVLANVRGRDLVGFVAEAQAAVANAVQVPGEYRLE